MVLKMHKSVCLIWAHSSNQTNRQWLRRPAEALQERESECLIWENWLLTGNVHIWREKWNIQQRSSSQPVSHSILSIAVEIWYYKSLIYRSLVMLWRLILHFIPKQFDKYLSNYTNMLEQYLWAIIIYVVKNIFFTWSLKILW